MDNEQLQELLENLEIKFSDAISQIQHDLAGLKSRLDDLEYRAVSDVQYNLRKIERQISDLERDISSIRRSR